MLLLDTGTGGTKAEIRWRQRRGDGGGVQRRWAPHRDREHRRDDHAVGCDDRRAAAGPRGPCRARSSTSAFAGRPPSDSTASRDDRGIFEWDPEASSLARRLVEGPSPLAQRRLVLVSPAGDSALVARRGAASSASTSDRATSRCSKGRRLRLWLWAAYTPDGSSVGGVHEPTGRRACGTWTPASCSPAGPGRGSPNFGAIAFSPDGRHRARWRTADGPWWSSTQRRCPRPVGRWSRRRALLGSEASEGGSSRSRASLRTLPKVRTSCSATSTKVGSRRSASITPARARNFSPDGGRYAFGGVDGHVAVVDVATGDGDAGPAIPFTADRVEWVAFSPDGETLASLGLRRRPRAVADADTGPRPARTRPGPGQRAPSRYILAGRRHHRDRLRGGLVVAHDVGPDAWLEPRVSRGTGRDLTAAEWR